MNILYISANENINKPINLIKNNKDFSLKIYGFEKTVEYFQNIWAYSTDFCFKRKNKETLNGKFDFLYYPDGTILVSIVPDGDNKIIETNDADYIESSLKEDSSYQEMIKEHNLFIENINVLLDNNSKSQWGIWKKCENENSYKNILRVNNIHFNIIVNLKKENNTNQINSILISQDKEVIAKYFEIKELIIEKHLALFEKWNQEMLYL